MSAEENKATVCRLVEEGWNKGDVDAIVAASAPSFTTHSPASGAAPNLEGLRQGAAMYFRAFPDLHFTIEDQIAECDKVVTRWSSTGTHQGEFLGMPPTGKSVTCTGINITRFENGMIVEEWQNLDLLGVLQQLGALPGAG